MESAEMRYHHWSLSQSQLDYPQVGTSPPSLINCRSRHKGTGRREGDSRVDEPPQGWITCQRDVAPEPTPNPTHQVDSEPENGLGTGRDTLMYSKYSIDLVMLHIFDIVRQGLLYAMFVWNKD